MALLLLYHGLILIETMPKPATKSELVAASQRNFEKLNALVDSFSEQEQYAQFPKGTLNRNIRDVLAHLHHWHLLLLGWYARGMKGEKAEMPAKGYAWQQTPALNRAIWEKYQSVELSEVRERLNESYGDLQHMIAHHSDEELFEKKRYAWTGSTSLAAYVIANTSSHYVWAYKLIRRAKR